MKILIIGGTNFIGPPLVHQLVAIGHEVSIFHRGTTTTNLPLNVHKILGDRSHLWEMRSQFQQLAPQVVVDMVAYTEQDALTLMNTFKGIARRIVVISSIDVYRAYDVLWGKESDVIPVPLTEDSPLRQQLCPYREMSSRPLNVPVEYEKILVERVVMAGDLPGTILRLPMVYGSRDILHRLYAYIQRMDDNRPAIVLSESIARWRGSYGYVENIAYAIALAVINQNATGRIYHVADVAALTEAERITRVGEIVGWQGKVVVVPNSQLPQDRKLSLNLEQHWVVNSTRIRQELGYQEIVPLDEALARTIAWQKTHPPQEPQQFAMPWLLDYSTEDVILGGIL
ncbi:NAD-dependent epimerase/dehydratase family protein [Komarekiella sp. 'clone 1']|uniref:NAD-dependent epimerase/dehydratase family protein n=1 Tax=Komarekiella delphini-convector SJRDD-AB1 TaxID=2593771 RepID=A0AA40SXN1_9NOST|nr:NAD-dependent epimerase/dehydratase family protein [Komarekiella delphini-convector]MBD6617179.1 NAD-dependent epimerase/dehydratase family protein [Komarekiella delphini-convector SJRDD-AB1]